MAVDQQAVLAELARREMERRQPKPYEEQSFTERLKTNTSNAPGVGLGETALQLGSGAIAGIPAGIAGIAGAVLPGEQGQGAHWVEAVQNALTYEPKSNAGKKISGVVAKPFEWLDQGATFVGDKGGGSNPMAETAIKTALLAAPMLVGARGKAPVIKAGEVRVPKVADLVDTPKKKSRRLIAQALERDGLTPQEAAAKLKALGPNARLADLGENLAGLARAATAKPGPARTLAKDFLEERQAGQQMRLIKTTGLGDVKSFKDAFVSKMRDRHSQASPLYREAYDSPLNLTSPEMNALLNRPTMQAVLKDAAKVLMDEGGGAGNVRLMDAAKRSLDDKIGSAIRSGKREKARRLTMLKNQLLDEVDRQVPVFKEARDIYAGEAAMRDSAQLGRNLLTKKLDLDDAEMLVGKMGNGELKAFQMGAMRGLIDKLEGTANNRNAAGKLIESQRAREVLELAFPNRAALERLLKGAETESRFSGTRQTVRGGSPTARIQNEVSGLESTASAVAAMAQSPVLGTAREILKRLGIGKVSDKTLAEVGRLLFEEVEPPPGMVYNQRGELVPNPVGPGRKVKVPLIALPSAESAAATSLLTEGGK